MVELRVHNVRNLRIDTFGNENNQTFFANVCYTTIQLSSLRYNTRLEKPVHGFYHQKYPHTLRIVIS